MNIANIVKMLPGDGTLTRRVLKRCREANFKVQTDTRSVAIGSRKFKRRIVAYYVPAQIYDEEKLRRQKEEVSHRIKEVAERMKILAKDHPQLSSEVLQALAQSGKPIYLAGDLGYSCKVATKTYWSLLGFNVTEKPSGIAVNGRKLFDVYHSNQLAPKACRISVEKLKKKWLDKYGNEQFVLAQAVSIANRLQKVNKCRGFYSLKDRWITESQDYLVSGRLVYSTPEDELYQHRFSISGQVFVFHSRIVPKHVACERVVEPYQPQPFAEDELPCPPQCIVVELIKEMLCTPTDGNGASIRRERNEG